MKKLLLGGLLAAVVCGCTTVDSTQRFNQMGLGTPNEKAVCQTYVEIPYFTFFGLPILGGGNKGDGDWSCFERATTTDNVVYLLTKEAKKKGAARVINVSVNKTYKDAFLLFGYETIQASGTGVRTKSAAINRAIEDYDQTR